MTNSRRKGQVYEREANAWGSKVFGPRWTWLNGPGHDGEDFDLDGRISIEAKNHARLELAAWHAQADRDAGPDRIPVVLHKRRGKADVGDHWVTMTARDFAALFHLLRSSS